jgi:hypothetical protein
MPFDLQTIRRHCPCKKHGAGSLDQGAWGKGENLLGEGLGEKKKGNEAIDETRPFHLHEKQRPESDG